MRCPFRPYIGIRPADDKVAAARTRRGHGAATARAVARLAARGESGARTVFDVTLADLSPTSPEELRAHYL